MLIEESEFITECIAREAFIIKSVSKLNERLLASGCVVKCYTDGRPPNFIKRTEVRCDQCGREAIASITKVS